MPFLSRRPIEVSTLLSEVASGARGGTACFVGTVRNHQGGRAVVRLEYTAYEAMAEAECALIVAEAAERWPAAVALEHRLGTLVVGDVAVAVVAAASHRSEAFEACRYVIEEVKRRVPVWKKEFYADGTIGWVEPGQPEPAASEVAIEAR